MNDIDKTLKLADLYKEKATIYKRFKLTFERLEQIDAEIAQIGRPNLGQTKSFVIDKVVEILKEHPNGLRQVEIANKVDRSQPQISRIFTLNPDLFEKSGRVWKLKKQENVVQLENVAK